MLIPSPFLIVLTVLTRIVHFWLCIGATSRIGNTMCYNVAEYHLLTESVLDLTTD